MGYDSTSGESDQARRDPPPSLGTVIQPDITHVDPPENLKLRIRESYNAIAPSYNQWTLMHRGQRTDYTIKLIALLREEQARRNEARSTVVDITQYPKHVEPTQHTENPPQEASSVAQPMESPKEAKLALITSVSEIPGYEQTRRPDQGSGAHGKQKDSYTRQGPSLLAEAGIIIVRLNKMRVLEVGCGDGVPVAETLLAEEVGVVGVDISETQIALCHAHFPNQLATRQASWMQRDMMDLLFPRERFDAIVALYSLFHLPREEQTVFLARAQQWLRPGGLILFNFPEVENEGEVEEEWLGLQKGWVYRSSWGEEKMIRYVEGLEGMKVLVKEVTEPEAKNPDPKFVWVIAKKSA